MRKARSKKLLTLLATVGFCVGTGLAMGQAEGTKVMPRLQPVLAADSPIAVSQNDVFGVAADRSRILRRSLDGGVWSTLRTGQSFSSITALASSGRDLYLVDENGPVLYQINVDSGNAAILHRGAPFRRPISLAAAHGTIYIADLDGSVYGFSLTDRALSRTELGRLSALSHSGHTHLFASPEQLFISNPEDGFLIALSYPAAASPITLTSYVCRAGSCLDVSPSRAKTSLPDVLPSEDKVGTILNPGSVASISGIIYVIDEQRQQIFASSRHSLRPVRLYSWDFPVKHPTQIQVNSDSLLITDAATQNLVVWPLLVPTEVVVDVRTSEALSAVYNYLYDRGILPTRSAILRGSIEKTLRREGALLSPYVPTLNRVVCGLNHAICKHGRPRKLLASGLPIAIPDLYSETYIDTRLVTLDGQKSVEEEVDKRISSPELKDWGSEDKLRSLNAGLLSKSIKEIRHQRMGTYILPIELVRYVVAMPAKDVLNSNTTLASLQRTFREDLTVRPLEELRATLQQTASVSATVEDLDSQFKTVLTTIDYSRPSNLISRPYIGVAEDQIDCDDPDFDHDVCSVLDDIVVSTPQTMTLSSSSGAVQLRQFDKLDHGTAVAGLIGARSMFKDARGLAAPEAYVVPLRTTDKELADDIRSAFLRNARIFNLSLSFDAKFPKSLSDIVSAKARYSGPYTKAALFVVSAPDDGKPSCQPNAERYPVCWGAQDNVISVAATTLDGKALLPNIGNSAWGSDYVHVAAPGVGFGAPGRNHSYVPVAGTSFAAPMVSATAALLYEQGLQEPRLIKQRILATSTLIPAYDGKIEAGLLDVRHAVTNIGRSVLIDGVRAETVAELVPSGSLNLVWSGGRCSALPIKNLLRLVKTDQTYTAIYQDPEDGVFRMRVGVSPPEGQNWVVPIRFLSPDGKLSALTSVNLLNYLDYFGPIY